MKDYMRAVLAESGTLTFEDIVIRIAAAAVISVAIYLSYWYTHAGTTYSKKFNVSLVTLTILTGTVMTVIGNNVALSLGMVGALSIVRFRTAIKDSRDTTYIFWAIIVGICCGVGDYRVASVGTVVVFIVLMILGRVRNENRILLIIRGAKSKAMDMEGVVFEFFGGKAFLKVKNTTAEVVELIYEMPRKAYEVTYKKDVDITDKLYALGGVEYVNIVTQSDEITGAITVRTKLFYAGTIAAVIVAAVVFHGMDSENGAKRYMQHTEAMPAEERPETGFSSHLPVISVETEGRQDILWLSPGGYLYGKDNLPLELTPYTGDEELLKYPCDVAVVSREGTWHSPEDAPQLTSRATIRVRGNSSRLLDKKSYQLKLMDEQGLERKEPMMGMSAADEWVLNGPILDRTLVRNYVCYTTAGQVMDYAPNLRFCELFLNGEYRGVYLMTEAITKDKGRLNLTVPERGRPVTSWIVRWDRKGKADTQVNDFTTYTYQSEVSTLDLRYPGKNTLTPERLAYVEEELSRAERAFDSADRSDPAKGWQTYLDKEGFAQYFVLNEFFRNIDAGRFSAYYYKDARGKIAPVVWDFNNGCDNYINTTHDTSGFSMTDTMWYGELLQDEEFVDEVIRQYRSMRKGVLSDESLNKLIDDTVAYLKHAVDRNYEKYGYVFDLSQTDDRNYLQPVERNYVSYEESVEQLKSWLNARGAWMDAHMDSLQQYCHESRNAARMIQ